MPKHRAARRFPDNQKPDGKYIWQMQAQMSCTNREWCDFVSFDDRMPERLAYDRIRVFRDEEKILLIEQEVEKFLEELDELEKRFKQ